MNATDPASWHGRLAPWLLWLAGLLALFHPTLLSGFDRDQILPRDPAMAATYFEHTWLWVSGAPHHGDYWSPPQFFPAQGVGGYGDTVAGAAPPYWLARALGVAPLAAFQVWMMAALSLCFLAVWLLLRRVLALGAWPAAVGAFLFGFGSGRASHLVSPQLFGCFWGLFALAAMGAALVGAAREAKARTRCWLFVAAVCGALQFWSALYPTMLLALVLAAELAVSLALPATRRPLLALVRRHPLALLLSALLLAALVAPMAAGHLAVADTVGSPSARKVIERLPGWRSWLWTGTRSLFAPLHEALGLRVDGALASMQALGVGLLTTVLALLGLWGARRRPAAQVVAGTTLLVVLLAARWPGGFVPWRMIHAWLPGAETIRYPARIGMYLGVAAAVGVAFWVQARMSSGRGRLAALLLLPLCLAEQLHELSSYDALGYRQTLQRLAARVDKDKAAFYLVTADDGVARVPERDSLTVKNKPSQVLATWVSLVAVHPTVNGSSGRRPPGWELAWNNLGAVSDDGVITAEGLERNLAAWLSAHDVPRQDVQWLQVPWSELSWNFVPPEESGDAEGPEDADADG